MEMPEKVLEALAAKYSNIREGVKSAMGGIVLDYEAKRIYNQGRAESYAEGYAESYAEGYAESYAESYAKSYAKGVVKGANIVCTLIQMLIADGRNEDVQKVLVDSVLRDKLIVVRQIRCGINRHGNCGRIVV